MSAEKLVRMDEFSLMKYIKRIEIDRKHRKAAIKIQQWWRKVRPTRMKGIKELLPLIKSVSIISDWYKGLKLMRKEKKMKEKILVQTLKI